MDFHYDWTILSVLTTCSSRVIDNIQSKALIVSECDSFHSALWQRFVEFKELLDFSLSICPSPQSSFSVSLSFSLAHFPLLILQFTLFFRRFSSLLTICLLCFLVRAHTLCICFRFSLSFFHYSAIVSTITDFFSKGTFHFYITQDYAVKTVINLLRNSPKEFLTTLVFILFVVIYQECELVKHL